MDMRKPMPKDVGMSMSSTATMLAYVYTERQRGWRRRW
jgi:hypothetical protein